jgi:hypothetical protein
LEQVRAKAEAIAVIHDRTTQEDDQLFTCLMSSLTKAARNSVNLRCDDFMVGTEHSGILLFKVILAKSQVDTRATIALLMGKLTTGLPNIMASHGNNITEFNAEVMETLRKLQSRGKGGSTEIDLLPQLFVAYSSCGSPDTPIHRYIEHLENRHNDGDITLSTKSLMDKAETKYEELKDKVKFTHNDNSMGMGNKESEGEIMALKAEIEKLKRRDLASGIRGPLRGNDQNHHRGRQTYHTNDWATTKPTDGSLEKLVNGKTYHWCEGNSGRHHPPKWVIHKPSECTNLKKTSSTNRDYGNTTQRSAVNTPSWSTSMIAALQDSDEE